MNVFKHPFVKKHIDKVLKSVERVAKNAEDFDKAKNILTNNNNLEKALGVKTSEEKPYIGNYYFNMKGEIIGTDELGGENNIYIVKDFYDEKVPTFYITREFQNKYAGRIIRLDEYNFTKNAKLLALILNFYSVKCLNISLSHLHNQSFSVYCPKGELNNYNEHPNAQGGSDSGFTMIDKQTGLAFIHINLDSNVLLYDKELCNYFNLMNVIVHENTHTTMRYYDEQSKEWRIKISTLGGNMDYEQSNNASENHLQVYKKQILHWTWKFCSIEHKKSTMDTICTILPYNKRVDSWKQFLETNVPVKITSKITLNVVTYSYEFTTK